MKRIAEFIVAVVVINVLLHVVPLPDVDLSSISFPDLPDWVRTVLRIKNVALIAIVLAVIVGAAVEQRRRQPR